MSTAVETAPQGPAMATAIASVMPVSATMPPVPDGGDATSSASSMLAGGSSGTPGPATDAGSAATASRGVADQTIAPAINTARVLQSMQGSEMRVGMHSVEFGRVSINTTVTHGAVAAQISFDHAELGRTLAAHLPAIEARLTRETGAEARVELRQGGNTGSMASMDSSGGSRREPGDEPRQRAAYAAESQLPGVLSAEPGAALAAHHGVTAQPGRLDIRI